MAYKDSEQAREYHKAWVKANREKRLEHQRAYRARNQDRLRAASSSEDSRAKRRERYAQNKEERQAKARAYYAKNRDRIRANQASRSPAAHREWYQRNKTQVQAYGYARRHGLRPEDLATLWDAQDSRCYLCGEPLSVAPKQTHIDHDHSCCPDGKSCKVCRRGLACKRCNSAIGLVGDDSALLRRLADALEAANLGVAQRRKAIAAGQLELLGASHG